MILSLKCSENANYPIIYISTYEEERVEYIIRYCVKKYVSRTFYSWDFIDGYQGNPNDIGFALKNPLEVFFSAVLKDCNIVINL